MHSLPEGSCKEQMKLNISYSIQEGLLSLHSLHKKKKIKKKPQIQQYKSNPIAQWAQCAAPPRCLLWSFGPLDAQPSSSAICSTQRLFPRVSSSPHICHCICGHLTILEIQIPHRLHFIRGHIFTIGLLASLQKLWTCLIAPSCRHFHHHSPYIVHAFKTSTVWVTFIFCKIWQPVCHA